MIIEYRSPTGKTWRKVAGTYHEKLHAVIVNALPCEYMLIRSVYWRLNQDDARIYTTWMVEQGRVVRLSELEVRV